jgi:transcriptional regulator with XRE-family HTH domain
MGRLLRKARLALGLSQFELSQKLGVTQGTISRAEAGRDLRASTLIEIARVLDLDLMIVPRRLRSNIEVMVEGARTSDHTAVYTGAGDEPYYEGDRDEIHEPTLEVSPNNLRRYLNPRRRARNDLGESGKST